MTIQRTMLLTTLLAYGCAPKNTQVKAPYTPFTMPVQDLQNEGEEDPLGIDGTSPFSETYDEVTVLFGLDNGTTISDSVNTQEGYGAVIECAQLSKATQCDITIANETSNQWYKVTIVDYANKGALDIAESQDYTGKDQSYYRGPGDLELLLNHPSLPLPSHIKEKLSEREIPEDEIGKIDNYTTTEHIHIPSDDPTIAALFAIADEIYAQAFTILGEPKKYERGAPVPKILTAQSADKLVELLTK